MGRLVTSQSLLKEKTLFPAFLLIIIIYSAPQIVIGCEQSKMSLYKDFNLLHSEKLQMSNLSFICFSVFLNLLIDVWMMSQILNNILPPWKCAKHYFSCGGGVKNLSFCIEFLPLPLWGMSSWVNHIISNIHFLYSYKKDENCHPQKAVEKKLWINVVARSFCTAKNDTLGVSHCQYSFLS